MRKLRPLGVRAAIGYLGSAVAIVLAIIGPYIVPFDPRTPTSSVLLPPSWQHPFGTDASGLDLVSVTVAAFRSDLVIAIVSVGLSFVLGLVLGSVSGFSAAGGRVWRFAARIVDAVLDVFQSIPVTVFALALVAVFGRDIWSVIAAVTFVTAPTFARLIRSSLRSVVNGGLVASCRVLGIGPMKTLVRHAIPNSIDGAVAYVSVAIGTAILVTASLSFLGAGIRPPTPEWGYTISAGAEYVATGQWWISVLPGLVLSVTVILFALAGDGIRTMLDAKSTDDDAGELALPLVPERTIK
jgi:peptide/nickel transport system permease protein